MFDDDDLVHARNRGGRSGVTSDQKVVFGQGDSGSRHNEIIREIHDRVHEDEQLSKEPHGEKNPPDKHQKQHVQHPATSLSRCHVVHSSKGT